MKKAIVSLMAMVTIGNVLIPSTVSVKAAEVSSISTNENLFSPKKINATLENFKIFLANKGLTIEEAKQLNSSEKEEIIQEYIDYLSTARVGINVIFGAITAAMTIVTGLYNAGHYAARQLDTRGILTKKEYKPNGGWIMAGIIAAFGIPAAMGFDDYMYNR